MPNLDWSDKAAAPPLALICFYYYFDASLQALICGFLILPVTEVSRISFRSSYRLPNGMPLFVTIRACAIRWSLQSRAIRWCSWIVWYGRRQSECRRKSANVCFHTDYDHIRRPHISTSSWHQPSFASLPFLSCISSYALSGTRPRRKFSRSTMLTRLTVSWHCLPVTIWDELYLREMKKSKSNTLPENLEVTPLCGWLCMGSGTEGSRACRHIYL